MIQMKLKEYIEDKGYNMNTFSIETGIKYERIFEYCKNKKQSVNLVHLNIIMKTLDITDFNLVMEYVEE